MLTGARIVTGMDVTGFMWWAVSGMALKMMEQDVREIKRSLIRGVGSEMKDMRMMMGEGRMTERLTEMLIGARMMTSMTRGKMIKMR